MIPIEIINNIYSFIQCNKQTTYNTECNLIKLQIRSNTFTVCTSHQPKIIDFILDNDDTLSYNYDIFLHESKKYKLSDIIETIDLLNLQKKHFFSIKHMCCNGNGICIRRTG